MFLQNSNDYIPRNKQRIEEYYLLVEGRYYKLNNKLIVAINIKINENTWEDGQGQQLSTEM
jgi:hypothetical protein